MVLAPGVAELKAGLLDQLRDQKALLQGLAEELLHQRRSTHARADNLKAADEKVAHLQVQDTTLNTPLLVIPIQLMPTKTHSNFHLHPI